MQVQPVGVPQPHRQERPRSPATQWTGPADPADQEGAVKPPGAAGLVPEAVRTLTHATLPGSYQWPSDLCTVIAELTVLVRALPTALGQAATWLETEHDAGHIRCDDDHNLTLTVHGTLLGLHDAVRHVEPLLRALNAATRHADHLTTRTT
jgi:hypothetical protein